jgi:hypothetical protein
MEITELEAMLLHSIISQIYSAFEAGDNHTIATAMNGFASEDHNTIQNLLPRLEDFIG